MSKLATLAISSSPDIPYDISVPYLLYQTTMLRKGLESDSNELTLFSMCNRMADMVKL